MSGDAILPRERPSGHVFGPHPKKSKRKRQRVAALANKRASSSRAGAKDPTFDMECMICRSMRPLTAFITTTGCNHKYCINCCSQHAEAKVAMPRCSQIRCPHETCPHNYDIYQCAALLSQPSFEILTTRQTEAAIPPSQRVYCPYNDCAVFMEKSESGDWACPSAECLTCHRAFCMKCRKPWQAAHNCTEVEAGEKGLRDLARRKNWRSCAGCKRMIERVDGCNHMTCLCGYEFCYACGEKWKCMC